MDGTYDYVTGGDPNPGDDLQRYNISKPLAYRFVFQGSHRVHNPKFLPDILDFNIIDMGRSSVVRYFSISRIHGALGDDGQNYKTLAYLIQHAPPPFQQNIRFVHGCNGYASASAEVLTLFV